MNIDNRIFERLLGNFSGKAIDLLNTLEENAAKEALTLVLNKLLQKTPLPATIREPVSARIAEYGSGMIRKIGTLARGFIPGAKAKKISLPLLRNSSDLSGGSETAIIPGSMKVIAAIGTWNTNPMVKGLRDVPPARDPAQRTQREQQQITFLRSYYRNILSGLDASDQAAFVRAVPPPYWIERDADSDGDVSEDGLPDHLDYDLDIYDDQAV